MLTLHRDEPESRAFPRVASYTASGDCVDLLGPTIDDINFSEIAHTMARMGRFGEKSPTKAFSVAQHSVIGADALWEKHACHKTALGFLVHDAHEPGGIGDIVTPAIKALDALQEDETKGQHFPFSKPSVLLARLKAIWDKQICDAARIDPHCLYQAPTPDIVNILGPSFDADAPAIARRVRQMDALMCEAEAFVLFGAKACARPAEFHTLKGLNKVWAPEKAWLAWLERFEKYAGFKP